MGGDGGGDAGDVVVLESAFLLDPTAACRPVTAPSFGSAARSCPSKPASVIGRLMPFRSRESYSNMAHGFRVFRNVSKPARAGFDSAILAPVLFIIFISTPY